MMDELDRRKLEIHRETLLDGIVEVQPILDELVSRSELNPISDDYQNILAGRTPRQQTRCLLDILPSLGAGAFSAFVASLANYRPHLRQLLEEDVPSDRLAC